MFVLVAKLLIPCVGLRGAHCENECFFGCSMFKLGYSLYSLLFLRSWWEGVARERLRHRPQVNTFITIFKKKKKSTVSSDHAFFFHSTCTLDFVLSTFSLISSADTSHLTVQTISYLWCPLDHGVNSDRQNKGGLL